MALVKVTRQITDENNDLSWGIFEVEESDLQPLELPLTVEEIKNTPAVYATETFYPDPFANLIQEIPPEETSE